MRKGTGQRLESCKRSERGKRSNKEQGRREIDKPVVNLGNKRQKERKTDR